MLTLIRNRIIHGGAAPSVRELMSELGFSSPRSAAVLVERLIDLGYLRRRPSDRMLQLLRLPDDAEESEVTVDVPLVGRAPCGAPLLAQENLEALIPVSIKLAKPGEKHFLLRAVGDSMTEAGIEDGSLVLVRQQQIARSGELVVALVDDEATIKELRRTADAAVLMPRTKNPVHQPIIMQRDFLIQGVVVTVIPDLSNDVSDGTATRCDP